MATAFQRVSYQHCRNGKETKEGKAIHSAIVPTAHNLKTARALGADKST